MSAALSGTAAALGEDMRHGIVSAFDRANRSGGIKGRKLELVVLDDGYDPVRAIKNTIELADSRGVLGMIGNVGTPTAVAVLPVVSDRKLLLFGAYTGAPVLRRSKPDPTVINFRVGYRQETSEIVRALIELGKLAPAEIALMTQNDSYGDAVFDGAAAELEKHGLVRQDVSHVRYERNTEAVENAVADLLQAPPAPRAVIMAGTPAPCAKFMRLARENGLKPIFIAISFTSSSALTKILGADAENLISTQVVPSFDSELPLVRDYRQDYAASAPGMAPSFVSLEGYVVGRILSRALESHAGEITRSSVVEALLSLGRFDIGLGAELELSGRSRQASGRIWPSIIRNGRPETYDWSELLDHPARRSS